MGEAEFFLLFPWFIVAVVIAGIVLLGDDY